MCSSIILAHLLLPVLTPFSRESTHLPLLIVSLCKQTTIAKSFNADLIKAGFLFTKVSMFNLKASQIVLSLYDI